VGLLCRDLTKRAKEQLDITIVIRDSVKKHIVEKGTNVKYGARPLRRAVQTELEDKIAEAILNGELTRGMEVEIGISKDDIKFYPKEIKN
jgi:ATP-dependent Clp protease ATP-binding subunit ClpC